ncbi:hypothetical protein Salat_0385800 [Sesamum alatum]|uniref:Uncharacterized protein n=1 Tax=Sesamum alatum TaxID=300844 RepID=A0AAE2D090_9LAMI|nr:hypothetical protein Salat_0385800 [Sesamum alatum]
MELSERFLEKIEADGQRSKVNKESKEWVAAGEAAGRQQMVWREEEDESSTDPCRPEKIKLESSKGQKGGDGGRRGIVPKLKAGFFEWSKGVDEESSGAAMVAGCDAAANGG